MTNLQESPGLLDLYDDDGHTLPFLLHFNPACFIIFNRSHLKRHPRRNVGGGEGGHLAVIAVAPCNFLRGTWWHLSPSRHRPFLNIPIRSRRVTNDRRDESSPFLGLTVPSYMGNVDLCRFSLLRIEVTAHSGH